MSPDTELIDPFYLFSFGFFLVLSQTWWETGKDIRVHAHIPALIESAPFPSVPVCLWKLIRNSAIRSTIFLFVFNASLIYKWGE